MDIAAVRALEGHRLWMRFEDGVEGEVALTSLVPFEGIFAVLRDPTRFAEVRVNADIGTICWPNGADLDPDVLYSHVTGRPLPCSERKSTSCPAPASLSSGRQAGFGGIR